MAAVAHGQEPAAPHASWEAAARELQQATVTVRIWEPAPSPGRRPEAVTVCSGVCVGAGRVVTAALVGSDSPLRLTLPGGAQADARLQVLDEYSGLALLHSDTLRLTPLPLDLQQPAVGSELLTAAAWGLAQPLVSKALVGGVDRQHRGASYPPLMQCDALTTQTSSGAGLVNRQGRLVGVIVAADSDGERRGWTYAVPASHVQRLLRAAGEQRGGGVTILKRRRPLVGLVLDQQGEAVVVIQVAAGGPADKAGIKAGDHILASDGVVIRSVYQAVLPTIYKQPGDTTTFRVQQAGSTQDVTVILGGGVELSSAPADLLAGLVQPKVRLARDTAGTIMAQRPAAGIREVFSPPLPDDAPPAAAAPSAAEKLALLEKAISRYQAVIELQQRQLAEEQQRRQQQDEQLQALRNEFEALRRALAPQPNGRD